MRRGAAWFRGGNKRPAPRLAEKPLTDEQLERLNADAPIQGVFGPTTIDVTAEDILQKMPVDNRQMKRDRYLILLAQRLNAEETEKDVWTKFTIEDFCRLLDGASKFDKFTNDLKGRAGEDGARSVVERGIDSADLVQWTNPDGTVYYKPTLSLLELFLNIDSMKRYL